MISTFEVSLPGALEVYCTGGRIMIEEFFLRPERMTIHRSGAEPEGLVAQWPGEGYTFEAQEVMRCLRAGEQQSPLVPWRDTLAVARVLDRWRAALGEPEQVQPVIARLTGVIQPYAWGSATMIPQLLGIEPSGEPQAELWLGAHPLAPSTVDAQPLDELLAKDPRGLMGDATVQRSARGCRSCSRSSPQISRCRCKPIRRASRPRWASPANRRRGFPGTLPIGSIATAGPSQRCCVRCRTPRRCADSANPRRAMRSSNGSASAVLLRLVADLASAELAPEERLASVFERLLRLTGDPAGVVAEVVRGADEVLADGELGLFAQTARELGRFYPGRPRRPRRAADEPDRACTRTTPSSCRPAICTRICAAVGSR